MNAAVLLGLTIAVSAPVPKDRKAGQTVVGEWVVESATFGGRVTKVPDGLRYELTADGRWLSRRDGRPDSPARPYKLDPKADPPAIDLGRAAGDPGAHTQTGIYKVEGDTLTICLGTGDDRPPAFESPSGSRVMLMVLKRAKKK